MAITQRELIKFKELTNQKRELEKEIQEMRKDLCTRFFDLEEYVETGLLRLIPKDGQRRPAWKNYVIRLKGEGYVKNVIAHTEPGPPTIEVR